MFNPYRSLQIFLTQKIFFSILRQNVVIQPKIRIYNINKKFFETVPNSGQGLRRVGELRPEFGTRAQGV